MKIQVISGHLTQTEKVHIKKLLELNILEGKVNIKNYFLDKINDSYKVQIFTPSKNDYGKKIQQKNISYFKVI